MRVQICFEEEAQEAREKLKELVLSTGRAKSEEHAERLLQQRPLEDRCARPCLACVCQLNRLSLHARHCLQAGPS